jgi:predicted GNAT family N-acyltransferase
MSYSVCRVNWEQAAPLLRNLREKVFICEWRIPKKVEFDRKDRQAFHMLVCDDISQEPVATGRILPTGEISRIAVLNSYRKDEIVELVLSGLIEIAKELELKEVFINSPLENVHYFSQNSFQTAGAVYMEAGMPRQKMTCLIENLSVAKFYLSH